MGSQNAKAESNQNNSFINQTGAELEGADPINLDEDSQSSFLSNSQLEPPAQGSNLVVNTFRWNHGGNDVYVIGSFNGWKERVHMDKIGNEFTKEHPLERGVIHEYKFIVDNDWRFAPDQPTKKDQHNNINNWVDTSTFPVICRGADETKIGDGYTQELCADFTIMEPEPLPLHLHHVLTNHSNSYDYRQKNFIPVNSPIRQTNAELAGENNLPPNELPVPPHVILNHVGVRANESVLGLTMTQRFREKFVTTIYYKPLNKL